MGGGRLKQRVFGCAASVVAVGLFTFRPAQAHFILQAPVSWMSQDALGIPEKLGPCGDEGGGTPSDVVTVFQSGQTITVTINEVIFHPGHYRIALAVNDRSELPAEPVVTVGATPCGTVPVESPPVFPVLADNVFEHTTPFTSPQTVKITLPSDVTCTKCTLQVIEFMSDHPLNVPGGCFYHHCADLAIQSPSMATPDAGGNPLGTTVTVDAGSMDAAMSPPGETAPSPSTGSTASSGSSGGTGTPSSGCAVGSRQTGSRGGLAGLALLAMALGAARRRRGSSS